MLQAVERRAQALGVTLRRARADDAEDFARTMNDPMVFPGTMQLPYTDASYWRERLSVASGPSVADLSLVVEHEGHAVASCGLHAWPQVRRRHALYLGITVSGTWQGRGLGDLMMMAMCHHADRWLGAARIELTVFVDNARAIALYRKHGFADEGVLRAFALRDGAYVDVLTMARLNPAMLHLPRVAHPDDALHIDDSMSRPPP
jgi:L-phenylalanine/L-methionine N-acetyltransferase